MGFIFFSTSASEIELTTPSFEPAHAAFHSASLRFSVATSQGLQGSNPRHVKYSSKLSDEGSSKRDTELSPLARGILENLMAAALPR
jgi:hypothetical protein